MGRKNMKKNPSTSKAQHKLVRTTWEMMGMVGSPVTRVVPNKKGKGSYKRRNKHDKSSLDW